MADRLSVSAPAKVNLRLAILAREEAGFHSLETLFCGLSLADKLVVRRGGEGVELTVSGSVDTGPLENNLVLVAARAFYAATGLMPGVHLSLTKRIPAAAGLGGGSSDAAAALRALNALHGSPLDSTRLLQIGANIGSDVPFFLSHSPFALAWSRGERLLALEALPVRPVLIAHPGIPISTPAAFARIDELRDQRRTEFSALQPVSLQVGTLDSWSVIARHATNDFHPVAQEAIPNFVEALETLKRYGAEIALLAGSGSALFGVFAADGTHVDDAARQLTKLNFTTCRTETLDQWPEPARD